MATRIPRESLKARFIFPSKLLFALHAHQFSVSREAKVMYHAREAWNNVMSGAYNDAVPHATALGQQAWRGIQHVTRSWRQASIAAATTRDMWATVNDWHGVNRLRARAGARNEYSAPIKSADNPNQWNDSRTGSSVVPPSLQSVLRLSRRPRRRYRRRRYYPKMRKVWRGVPRRVARRVY